ncbi:bifunctional phosphopantothenoylcysteine decarboxylase/phosphopantothenate--cysteine ligase CoaBC [soil metagenome]
MLRGKKILLGVCGSIAAYKAALLIRLLIKEEAEVQVIMTTAASSFITPLTLSTLSKKPVLINFEKDETGTWNNHVELGLWADVFIVAPASANTIAKFATGYCNNLLSAVYLSARCPVLISPAMDLDMYQHPATKTNLKKLRAFGNIIIDAEFGELASGLTGTGRIAEPETIIQKLQEYFSENKPFKGKRILITAGPTYEEIDPVRFIGNFSTGKMGFALAERFSEMGAVVTLVSGPTHLQAKNNNINVIRVTTAAEMYRECTSQFKDMDIAILAAAVADFKPQKRSDQKIKKGSTLVLELEKTSDIAAELGKLKNKDQILVGFALETENEQENAQKKLISKNFDFIVLNSLNEKGAGFGHDTNQVYLIKKNNKIKKIELSSKTEIANEIALEVLDYLNIR